MFYFLIRQKGPAGLDSIHMTLMMMLIWNFGMERAEFTNNQIMFTAVGAAGAIPRENLRATIRGISSQNTLRRIPQLE